jgi:hypothetical protein
MTWLSDKIESLDDPGAPVTSTRTLDTEFTPSATKYTLVSYVVQLLVAAGATASVELRSDADSPPTTVRDVASLAVVGAGDTVTVKQSISHLVQPGHVVKLVSAGTAATITAVQVETIIS